MRGLDGVLAAREPCERRLELVDRRAGEEAEAAQIDAENRYLVGLQEPGAAQQRAVATQGEERIERRRVLEQRARRPLLEQVLLHEQLDAQARRDLAKRAQHSPEPGIDIPAMPDHAEANHPAIASLSCSARTRSAMPSGVSPHASS